MDFLTVRKLSHEVIISTHQAEDVGLGQSAGGGNTEDGGLCGEDDNEESEIMKDVLPRPRQLCEEI